jgi:hypothetical protein
MWGNLWDSTSRSRKEWRAIAQEYGILTSNHILIMELVRFIPKDALYKLNIGKPGPFGEIGVGVLVDRINSMTLIICISYFFIGIHYSRF